MPSWRFLLDENIDPKVATYLEKAALDAEHVRDALGQGANDQTDVVPYARSHDRIVVTSDLADFGALPESAPGVVLRQDDTMPAYEVASALISMVDTYPDRDSFPGREELDAWA